MEEEIRELSAGLRSGSLTAEALLDRCLERIRRLDPQLNSFVALDEAGARAAAKASDARLAGGTARSALEGIPLSVKDNIHAAGLPTTWGSRALAGVLPNGDELPVARLRAAGAVVVGKTNVPELTLEGYTKNDLFGVTRNPWDTRLTPGGSSGGAAAGVAAGLVPGAIGTDGGGSVRRPACHTGLVGWKPSTGRIPRVDGLPAILTDFETIGTLDALDRRCAAARQRHGRPGRPRPPFALRRCPAAAGGPMAHHLHSAVRRCSGRSRSGLGRPPAWPKLWRGKAVKLSRKMSSLTSRTPRVSGMSSRAPASPG